MLGFLTGMRMAVAEAVSPHGPRSLCLKWESCQDVNLTVLADPHSDGFGQPAPRTLLGGGLTDTPLIFRDKQTLALTIANVYVEGLAGIMYTDREVYAVVGLNTNLPRDFRGAADRTFEYEEVVSMLHPSITNYYHWTAEGLTRLLLSLDYYFGDDGVAPKAALLMPAKSEAPMAWEMLRTLAFEGPTVEYFSHPSTR